MRPDLAQLSHEALAGLSNWGLVKRALKEIEAGQGPQLEAEGEAVVARFPDGVECRLAESQPWTAARCSCGANMCRHRVALVLALPATVAVVEALAVAVPDWEKVLGKRLLERAHRERAKGLQAELTGPPWQVRLATNTVRFLAGGDVNYARCDCEQPWPCEHLALAAWVADALECRPGRVDWGQARAEVSLDLSEIWHDGCTGRLPAAPAGCTWLQLLLEELAELQAAYRLGSAHYDSQHWLFCALSLWCRSRAQSAELSADYRLGRDQPLEQELEQIRLCSLGATRNRAGTDLFFADPAGVVMRLNLPPDKSPGGGLRMPDLAYGQLVTRGVVRRANRTFRLRRERQRHSLSPLGQAWETLHPSLLWPGIDAFAGRQAGQVSRLLRPVLECEDFVVVPVEEVAGLVYLPGPQRLVGTATDLHGGSLTLERSHRAEAPHALDVLAHRLPEARCLTGRLDFSSGHPVLDPVAFWTDSGLCIPDLEQAANDWELPWVVEQELANPLQQMLNEALGLCAETLHLGRAAQLPSFDARRLELAGRLEEAGLTGLAERLRGSWQAEDFWPCALRLYLARENLSQLGS